MADTKRKDDVLNLLTKMNKKIDRLGREMKQEQRKIRHQLMYVQRQFRDKTNHTTKVKLPPTTVSGSVTSDGCLSGYEHLHKDVLRENIVMMTNRMHLKKDLVLDDLIAEKCLSEDEAACVRDKNDRKDQTRKLIALMSNRSHTNFMQFVKILSKNENYPDIGNKLKEKIEMKQREEPRQKQCIPCVIMRDVNIKDIIDPLYANGLIDLNSLEFLTDCNSYDKRDTGEIWRGIFTNVENSSEEICIENFQNSLQEKYDYISKKLTHSSSLHCRCEKELFEKHSTTLSCTESIDENSTTSTRLTIRDVSSIISGQSEEQESTFVPYKHKLIEKWVNDTQNLVKFETGTQTAVHSIPSIPDNRSKIHQVQKTKHASGFIKNSGQIQLNIDSSAQMKNSNSDYMTENMPKLINPMQTKQSKASTLEISMDNGSEVQPTEKKKETRAIIDSENPVPDIRSTANQLNMFVPEFSFMKLPGKSKSHIDSLVQMKHRNSDFMEPSTDNRPNTIENSTENGSEIHPSEKRKETQFNVHSIKPVADENKSKVNIHVETNRSSLDFEVMKSSNEKKSKVPMKIHSRKVLVSNTRGPVQVDLARTPITLKTTQMANSEKSDISLKRKRLSIWADNQRIREPKQEELSDEEILRSAKIAKRYNNYYRYFWDNR